MQGREYDYIKGSVAEAPLRKPKRTSKEKVSRRNKKRTSKAQLVKAERKNDRRYMAAVVVIILGLGCVTIAGDTKVYNMQKQVSSLDNQINDMKENSEALKVKILKYSSLSNIENNASSKLGMYVPQSSDVVKIDFSNNYFEGVKQETPQATSVDKNDIIHKLLKLFS